jgi:thiamine kinase-like enzyme
MKHEELLTLLGENCIYHSDINKENFLLDSGRVCIIDFQDIGVLPQAFCTYAFFNTRDFAASVGRRLGYQPSTIADAMARISSVIQQTGAG